MSGGQLWSKWENEKTKIKIKIKLCESYSVHVILDEIPAVLV